MSTLPNKKLVKLTSACSKHGMHIHHQVGPILDSRDVRESLGINRTAYVAAFFSGSRIGSNPNRGVTAEVITKSIASSGHITTLSGGGTYDGKKPTPGKTGIMGHVAYAMCLQDNGHFVITEDLACKEGLPPQAGTTLCLVENGGELRITERERSLIGPADVVITYSGAIGTPSESLTAVTGTAICSGTSRLDRANHRLNIIIDMPHPGRPHEPGENEGLIATIKNASYNGYTYNQEQIDNATLIYKPYPRFTDEMIAQDIRSLLALAHYRASIISPDLVEPIPAAILKRDLRGLYGRICPVYHHDIMEVKGWADYIEQAQAIARRKLLVHRAFHHTGPIS